MGLEFLEVALRDLDARGLLREPEGVGPDAASGGGGWVDACSNDYLGYARESVSRETEMALLTHRLGAGASRLIRGTHQAHVDLESRLADWVQLPAALLFSSGYAANVGALSALAGPNDIILSDALNHASIIDGCRLSRAEVIILPHCDAPALREALARTPAKTRRWVVTESYFSMDADTPDLTEVRGICDSSGAHLVVDEAHALGVFGPEGRGLCASLGVVPDVLIGTLGKALGTQGAFVAGPTLLRTWLWNRARSFVFSTATSPALAAITANRVARARRDDPARRRLEHLAASLRKTLRQSGLVVPSLSFGPIVPVIIGDTRRTVRTATALSALGIRVQAIRPPTVPDGTARLRITISASTSDAEFNRLTAALVATCAES
ncbi:MAG: 8-amino-7-oxononanoate synthase [Polyangiaceae bacterium]|nr:8-amino-7-oxononanoate synthase [Polyangiaceae bacterium]